MTNLIAVAQMTSTDHVEKNLQTCALLAEDAKARGTTLLCLPENFAYLPAQSEENLKIAEPLDGPLLKQYRNLAKKHQLWLSLGGFQETSPKPSSIFNTHVVVDPAGEIKAAYRKIHLFSLDIPKQPTFDESLTVTPGSQMVLAPSPLGSLGLSICYDLRFGELYQKLTQAGAQVLLVPAAFTDTTGKDHWEVLLRARAIENQCYVVAAAQTGTHHPARRTHGHGMIVDPWGTPIAQCSQGTQIACAEIDLSYLNRIRSQMPVLKHRRPEIYGNPVALE